MAAPWHFLQRSVSIVGTVSGTETSEFSFHTFVYFHFTWVWLLLWSFSVISCPPLWFWRVCMGGRVYCNALTLCVHCRQPLSPLEFSIQTAVMQKKKPQLCYPLCPVPGSVAIRADGKSGGSLSLPGSCARKCRAEATLAWSCRHNGWDPNPMTSKALFQSFHSFFMHSVHCFLFLIQIIFLFGGMGHLWCISFS